VGGFELPIFVCSQMMDVSRIVTTRSCCVERITVTVNRYR